MADTHAHEGFIIVNVFSVVPASGSAGKYKDPLFVKRGMMPLSFLVSKMPIFMEEKQYDPVETCYDLGHREAMLFVKLAEAGGNVAGAAAAQVPDVARYGASSH